MSEISLCFRAPNFCSFALLIILFPTSLVCSGEKHFVGFLMVSVPSPIIYRGYTEFASIREQVSFLCSRGRVLSDEMINSLSSQPLYQFTRFCSLFSSSPFCLRRSNWSLASSDTWFIIDDMSSCHASASLHQIKAVHQFSRSMQKYAMGENMQMCVFRIFGDFVSWVYWQPFFFSTSIGLGQSLFVLHF